MQNKLICHFLLILFFVSLDAKEPSLVFGAITTVKPNIVQDRFKPFFALIQKELNTSVRFLSAPTYPLSIQNFVDGSYDFGWIGSSPYVTAMQKKPGCLRLVAAIENQYGATYNGVIVVRKDSDIHSLDDLSGKRLAFGSPSSTLSYFVPKYMLMKNGVFDELAGKSFLGRHDKVIKNVIMGRTDAGAVKASVAETYQRFIRVIAKSEPFPDFAIVCTQRCSNDFYHKLKHLLLTLDDPFILESIKKGAIGFTPRDDSAYNRLRDIMRHVGSSSNQ